MKSPFQHGRSSYVHGDTGVYLIVSVRKAEQIVSSYRDSCAEINSAHDCYMCQPGEIFWK